jgi:hypothetical protein
LCDLFYRVCRDRSAEFMYIPKNGEKSPPIRLDIYRARVRQMAELLQEYF